MRIRCEDPGALCWRKARYIEMESNHKLCIHHALHAALDILETDGRMITIKED